MLLCRRLFFPYSTIKFSNLEKQGLASVHFPRYCFHCTSRQDFIFYIYHNSVLDQLVKKLLKIKRLQHFCNTNIRIPSCAQVKFGLNDKMTKSYFSVSTFVAITPKCEKGNTYFNQFLLVTVSLLSAVQTKTNNQIDSFYLNFKFTQSKKECIHQSSQWLIIIMQKCEKLTK